MIHLSYQNESVFVFNSDDWLKLRKIHRIVGALTGCLGSLPRQNIYQGLPMELMPEQAILLVKKCIAFINEWEELLHQPTDNKFITYKNEISKFQKEQNSIYKEKRIQEVEQRLNSIVNNKRKRKNSDSKDTKNDVRQIEINKINNIPADTITMPLQFDAPDYIKGAPKQVPLEIIYKKTNETRYEVFKDLWEKGYYITDGMNFGGDFLIYLGDPIEYHASFIVKCIYNRSKLNDPTEIIGIGRLGNTVKKIIIFAYLNSDKIIEYISIKGKLK